MTNSKWATFAALGFGLGIPLGAIAMGGAFYLMTQSPKPAPPSPHTLPPEASEAEPDAIELGVVDDTHVDGMLNSGDWTEC